MTHQELIDQAAIHVCSIGAVLIAEENPVSASRGGRNTVFHHCDIYQGRPSYASCLAIMDKTFEGTNEYRPECAEAIHNGTCPALAMRRAELQAGRALFFVDYTELSKRRKEQYAIDRENSVIQFRRNKATPTTRFPLTTVKVFDAEDIKARKTPPKNEVSEDDFNTNIMEQVVKKALNNDQ